MAGGDLWRPGGVRDAKREWLRCGVYDRLTEFYGMKECAAENEHKNADVERVLGRIGYQS